MELNFPKRKKTVTISAVALVAVIAVICVIVVIYLNRPKEPFADLTSTDIDHITAEYGIHSYELSDEEQEHFIELLKEIVIYGKDNSWAEYIGLDVDFETVFKKDGTSFDVKCCYPFVLIDGQGYKGEQKTCVDIQNYIHDIFLYQFYGARE